MKKEPRTIRRSRMLTWNRDNVMKGAIPNHPGYYKFYDKHGRLIYVGVARRLRHRVQSYLQKDCPKTHPTKTTLRPKIHKYAYTRVPLDHARKLEKRLKQRTRYNVL